MSKNQANKELKHEEKVHEKEEVVSKKDFEELKDTLQRIHAEFQNYRKRTEEDKAKFIKLSNEELIKKIIPILDNIELALKHNKEESEFSKGIILIYNQLTDILEQEGLQKINTMGKFDPQLHEAVMIEESDRESGSIIQELQKGYSLNNRVLRSSKVKISKQKSNKEVDKNE